MLAWVWKTFILRNFPLSDYCGEQNDGNFNACCNIEKDSKSGKFCVASFICTCKLNKLGNGQLLGSHRILSRRILFGSCPLPVQVSFIFDLSSLLWDSTLQPGNFIHFFISYHLYDHNDSSRSKNRASINLQSLAKDRGNSKRVDYLLSKGAG